MKLDFAALAHRQRITRMQRRVLIALAGLSAGPLASHAAPTGGRVTHGSGSITQNGSQTTVHAGNNAVVNWQSFNIAKGETTTFIQPSAASVAWNRITDKNPSQIFGNLNANGFVVLFNQSGFYFGPDSVVKVGGLLVSTAPMTMPGDGGGANWTYSGPPPTASIINYGKMETKNGGSLFLVAEKIENHGTLMAPDGTLGLYAGKEVLVSESPDGRGLSAKVALPEGSIDNTGKLIANAGTIAMHAQTVNNGGLIQANSFREHNGVIELIASDSINLAAHSIIQVKGDFTGKSAGGSISIKSEGRFTDTVGSIIDVRGGGVGGDGGAVEISAKQISAIHSHVDGTAQAGFKGGALLIDPTDIVFGFNNGGNPDAMYYDPSDASTFAGMAHVTFQASRDIFLNTTVNLSADSDRLLTLDAGRDIIFAENARINANTGWSVSLTAAGGIYLNGGPDFFGARQNGGGAIQTQNGNIDLHAGTDVLVGKGYVRTMGGGNINITAIGDVEAGRRSVREDSAASRPAPAAIFSFTRAATLLPGRRLSVPTEWVKFPRGGMSLWKGATCRGVFSCMKASAKSPRSMISVLRRRRAAWRFRSAVGKSRQPTIFFSTRFIIQTAPRIPLAASPTDSASITTREHRSY